MQGDSQLVRSDQGETSHSGTPRYSARRSRGIELATFRLPVNPSYLLSYCGPSPWSFIPRPIRPYEEVLY